MAPRLDSQILRVRGPGEKSPNSRMIEFRDQSLWDRDGPPVSEFE